MWKIFLLMIIHLFAVPAWASVNSLTVTQSQNIPCGDHVCTEVQGRMNGNAVGGSGGPYSVPFTLIFDPTNPKDVAIVDIVNTSLLTLSFLDTMNTEDPEFFRLHYEARLFLGDDFISQDYVYFAIGWDMQAMGLCAFFGEENCTGEMTEEEDGYWIIKDASQFIKSEHPDLVALIGNNPPDKSIAFGYSQTSYLLQHIYKKEQMDMNFDGVMMGGTDATCIRLINGSGWTIEPGCEGMMPPLAGKTCILNAESDVQQGGVLIRGDTEFYRVWEVPGTSHYSTQIEDSSIWGATRQNPVDLRPIYRGAMEQCTDWVVNDRPPEPSRYIDLVYQSEEPGVICENNLPCYTLENIFPFIDDPSTPDNEGLWPIFQLNRDPEGGCATGGIRPAACEAPLGIYNGIETNLSFTEGFFARTSLVAVTGTYDRFSDKVIHDKFNNKKRYETQIMDALSRLLTDRFINQDDFEHLNALAQQCQVGKKIHLTDAQLLECHGL